MKNFTHLSLSWSVSRGVDTFGYNIARLDDQNTGKRYRCMGGGYDMTGTVFANWLQDVYQSELVDLVKTITMVDCGYQVKGYLKNEKLYGLNVTPKGAVTLDGACGLSSMIAVCDALGLDVERTGNRKGHTTGFYVTSKESTNR